MPIIRVQYDNNKFQKEFLNELVVELQKIVSEATKIKEVFVYVNSAEITYLADPIEIFIEMSASKIDNLDELFKTISNKVKNWKQESGFSIPINLTLIPMNWKLEIGI
jgi:hypothetical protein